MKTARERAIDLASAMSCEPCSDCGHRHEEPDDCGHRDKHDGYCRCEREVPQECNVALATTAIEDAEARGFQAGQEAMRERIVEAARRTLSKDDNVHEWTKYARRIIDAAQALPAVPK